MGRVKNSLFSFVCGRHRCNRCKPKYYTTGDAVLSSDFLKLFLKIFLKKLLTRAEKCSIMYLQGKARATANKRERKRK